MNCLECINGCEKPYPKDCYAFFDRQKFYEKYIIKKGDLKMKIQKFIKITRIILLVTLIVILGYDILIACLRQWNATISKQTLLR